MFEDETGGVIIADSRSGLRLSCIGEPSLGYPTQIDVRAGPFTGSVRDDTVGNYAKFRSQLEALYNKLSGAAELGSYEGFSLKLTGNGRGQISVRAEVIGEHVPSIRLSFEFEIDQSYLPNIIQGLSAEFPHMVQKS